MNMVKQTKLAWASFFIIIFIAITASAQQVNYALASNNATIASNGGDGGTAYGSFSNIIDGDNTTSQGLTGGFGWRTVTVNLESPKNLTKVRVLTTHNEYGYIVAYDLSINFQNGTSQRLNKVYEGHTVTGLDFEEIPGAIGSKGNWENVVSITFHINGKADYGVNEIEAWGEEIIDNDNDGYDATIDCDDNNPNIHPNATETCDGIDNNCDGAIDEGCTSEDIFAPNQIKDLFLVSKGANWALVSWENPSDEDFKENLLYLNGESIANTSDEEYMLSNLNPNTTYNLTVYTIDNSSNMNTTGVSITFTTNENNGADSTAPGKITNLDLVTLGISKASFTWDNPTDEDFKECLIFLDGENIANTSSEYYRATGLDEDTRYTLTIYTIDNSSNMNSTGVSITFTTDDDNDDDSDSTSKKTVSFFPGRESISIGKINNSDTFLLNSQITKKEFKINWILLLIIAIALVILSIILVLFKRNH